MLTTRKASQPNWSTDGRLPRGCTSTARQPNQSATNERQTSSILEHLCTSRFSGESCPYHALSRQTDCRSKCRFVRETDDWARPCNIAQLKSTTANQPSTCSPQTALYHPQRLSSPVRELARLQALRCISEAIGRRPTSIQSLILIQAEIRTVRDFQLLDETGLHPEQLSLSRATSVSLLFPNPERLRRLRIAYVPCPGPSTSPSGPLEPSISHVLLHGPKTLFCSPSWTCIGFP